MDAIDEFKNDPFLFDLPGRVRNVSLPANSYNALVPLFESVSNAIQAVEARWGDQVTDKGKVEIIVHRRDDKDDSHVIGFTVTDNGIGLTEDHWKSFRTSDSPLKRAAGGKGVGRLSWLKAFHNCRITSRFENSGTVLQRSFAFSLKDASPIQDHTLVTAEAGKTPGTEVHLQPYEIDFEVHCPKRTTTIAAKLVGHFLHYLAVDKAPRIWLFDGGEKIDLKKHYTDNQAKNTVDIISVDLGLPSGPEEFQIFHALLRKQLKFHESGLHWTFYSGNQRVVRHDCIDGQLGLRYIGDDDDCVYVGLVAGKFLDNHVNQERTGFSFDPDSQTKIHKVAVDSAKAFLSNFIDQLRTQQVATTDRIIRENPQFLPFREALPDFVAKNLSLNKQNEEEIFLELSRQKLRTKRRLDGQIKSLKDQGPESVAETVQQISKALNDEKKGALAELVVRRKAILEVLSSSLAFKDKKDRRYYKEEVVHDLIVPLRSDSEDLHYDDHNLWVLDDRLAFYTFFRSDRPLRGYVDGSDSGREPDLSVVFEQALAFRRDGQDEPIVIVEFKRPGRDDFDGNSNPVTQVLEYVQLFRKGKGVLGKDGALIKPINGATRFICYVVADFTESLLEVVGNSLANNPTADGRGFFGISGPHNATIEVLPYEKVIGDAKIRNEAFFRQLGLI